MATLASSTTQNQVAVLQADGPGESFDTIHFNEYLKDGEQWAELLEMARDANQLARLARALIAGDDKFTADDRLQTNTTES
jgi:hypothetical protein